MDYIKKADISFYGIDDELKNNSSSIFSTNTNFSQDYLTYEAKIYTDNKNNIQTSNISTSIYNYDTYVYTEPSTSNVSFASGEINYTSYDSTKFANFTTLFKNNPPWGVYLAEDWRGTTLFDISGNNRHATTTGNIYSSNLSGNGATAPITYLSGDSNATITWTAGSIPTNFTILGLTRYTGTTRNRILTDDAGFFFHGHWNSSRGICYYGDGYKTSTLSKGTLTDWLCCIGKNGGATPNNILIDGVASGVATNGTGNRTLGINTYTEDSDFGFACAMVWDKHLADSDMVLLNSLINDYKAGIVNPRLFFPVYDYKYPILKTIDGIPINPLIWYKFDGDSNAMLNDSSGNGYNLTNNGTTYDSTNLIRGNGSVSFSNSTVTYLSMPTNINFNQINTTTGISICFWGRFTSGATYYERFFDFGCKVTGTNTVITTILICRDGNRNNILFQIYNKDNTPVSYAHTTTGIDFFDGKWRHINWTISTNGTWNIYINNVNIFSGIQSTIFPVSQDKSYFIGKAIQEDYRLGGNIDDFRIYNRVLTPAQVSELYYGKYIDKSYPIIKRNNVALNPLVWYKFDDSANLGKDEMGNHNLTNNNAVAFNSIDTTKGTGSGSFNGTNQYLSKASAFNLNNKNWSVSVWSKTNANNRYNMLLQIGSSFVQYELILLGYQNTNYIAIDRWGAFVSSSSPYLDAGFWVHLVFTYNSTNKTGKIYRNGILIASNTQASNFNTNNNIMIGALGTNYYGGLMDDLRIYESELSATEVQELYKGRVEILTTKTDRTLLSITNNNSLTVSGSSVDINPINTDYSYITFKNSGTLTLTQSLPCDIFMIGGGGGGGYDRAGGGGAGSAIVAINQVFNNGTYTIVVGNGGNGSTAYNNGTNGGDTEIFYPNNSTILFRAKGGGGGGAGASSTGANGGCGGGCASQIIGTGGIAVNTNIINGTTVNANSSSTNYATFGNKGGDNSIGYNGANLADLDGCGGGGIGTAGGNRTTAGTNVPTAGGNGLAVVTINGTQYNLKNHFSSSSTFGVVSSSLFYIGGGGGGGNSITGTGGAFGGLGGGGSGGEQGNDGSIGTANTGSGGGGGGGGARPGGAGGSGVVILRFKNSNITDRTILWNDRTIENISYLLEAVPSTFTKKNSKKFKFTLNSSIKQLKLSPKAKLVIESVVIPNVLSQSFLQSKAINNVILKMKGILNHNNFDSSTKGSGNTVIFSVPIKLNSQGFGNTYGAFRANYVSQHQSPRLNTETGFLFINPEPDVLYNFDINQNFIDDGEIEFTLIYDVGNVWKNNQTNNVYTNKPETLNFETDKQFLEGFNINFIIKDFDDSNNLVYSEKGLLNTINRNIF